MSAQSPTNSDPWTAEKNARRFALIDKEIAKTITPDQVIELRALERELDSCLDHVAPLPMPAVEALHRRLEQQMALQRND